MMSEENRNLPNPNYVTPKDGEVCGFYINEEGMKIARYNEATGDIEWSAYYETSREDPDACP